VKDLINKSHDYFVPPFLLTNLEFDTQVEVIRRHVFFNSQNNQKPAESTEEDKGSNSEEIIHLINFLGNIEDGNTQQVEGMLRLQKIVSGNPGAISPVVEVIKRSLRFDPPTDYYPLFKAIECMQRIGRGSPEAISVLIEVVNNDSDYGNYAIKLNAIAALAAISAGNQDVFNLLINLVHNENDWTIRLNALGGLGAILSSNLFGSAVANLRGYLRDSICKNNRALYVDCYCTLWHCAQNMTYPAFYQAWHQQEEVEKTTTSDSQSL
jgi:hypothetical protein